MVKWELISTDVNNTYRLKVPQGWIVKSYFTQGITMIFVPDEFHSWEIGDEA